MTDGARVWLLLGPRRGDAAQARALAEDLGRPWREFRLEHGPLREAPNVLLGASLASLRARPDGLEAPWPDLVIGVGRRTASAARWIRARSGGRTRLVWIGRPRAPLDWFDLVLSTPQYGLPAAPNLIRLALPWQNPLSTPPAAGSGAHVLGVLGGDSWGVRLGPVTADGLIDEALRRAAALGLPAAFVTSPRTPRHLTERLRSRLRPGDRFHDFAEPVRNPYREWLGTAAEVVVTGDSASTLADAAWTDRPVGVIPAPERAWLRALHRVGGAPVRRWRGRGGNLGIGAPPPDLGALLDALVARGLTRAGGGVLRLGPCRAVMEEERRASLMRIAALHA